MSRTAKNTLVALALALLLAPLAALHADDAARTNPADKRPNIVFCFADDWGRYASIYANVETRPSINQVIKTPVIDRMAREGVLFKNAFVTAPSCTPCRSSLLSGQYFFRTGRGAILQGAVWDSSIPELSAAVARRGLPHRQDLQGLEPGRAGRCAVRRPELCL